MSTATVERRSPLDASRRHTHPTLPQAGKARLKKPGTAKVSIYKMLSYAGGNSM